MSPFLAYLMTFLGVTGHASSEFFAVLSGVNGPEVSVWRYLLGAIGLLAICAVWPKHRDLATPLKQHWRRLIPLSIIGVSGAYLFFHWALDYATAIQVGTMVTTIPIFVGLANLVINKVGISTAKLVSGCAAVIGVALLLTDGVLSQLAGDSRSMIGILMALACAALGSTYAVLVKPLIVEHGAIRITTISMSIGAIGLWLIVGLFFSIWVNPLTLFDKAPLAAWSLLILGLWNTTITQLLWFGGLAAVPDITRGSYLFFLKPVITAFLALAFLGQPINSIEILAIIVICGSVLLELAWPRLSRTLQA
ncbi:MAG: DMT family transporter [Hyphomicrobiaceae bacterium]